MKLVAWRSAASLHLQKSRLCLHNSKLLQPCCTRAQSAHTKLVVWCPAASLHLWTLQHRPIIGVWQHAGTAAQVLLSAEPRMCTAMWP